MPWYMSNRLSINANKSAVMLIDKPSQVHKLCSNVAGKIFFLCRISIHLNYFMRKQSSLFFIMLVLCGVTQSKVTSQSYVLKITQLELFLATLIMLISEVLSYYVN